MRRGVRTVATTDAFRLTASRRAVGLLRPTEPLLALPDPGSKTTSTVDVLERATKAKLDKEAFEREQSARRARLHGSAAAASAAKPEVSDKRTASTPGKSGSAAPPGASPFLKRLNSMHTDMYETRKEVNITLKKEAKAEGLLQERRQLLRFREVDTELDRVIFWRDFIGWMGALRRGGVDSMVDQSLERELRYYAEESKKEVTHNAKLFQGLPFLNAGHSFPTLQKLTRLSAAAPQVEKRKAAASGSGKDAAQVKLLHTEKGQRVVGSGNDDGGVVLSRGDFAKPTMVTMSQLTYAGGYQQLDQEWVRLLRDDDDGGDHINAKPSAVDKAASRAASAPRRTLFNPANFNVVRLRSIDTHSVRTLRNVVLDMWARTASINEASETLVGEKIVREFMPHFGLRNFHSTYCFLVDTKGKVRWMSAGAPNQKEVEAFPGLLRDLELEMHRPSSR